MKVHLVLVQPGKNCKDAQSRSSLDCIVSKTTCNALPLHDLCIPFRAAAQALGNAYALPSNDSTDVLDSRVYGRQMCLIRSTLRCQLIRSVTRLYCH